MVATHTMAMRISVRYEPIDYAVVTPEMLISAAILAAAMRPILRSYRLAEPPFAKAECAYAVKFC